MTRRSILTSKMKRFEGNLSRTLEELDNDVNKELERILVLAHKSYDNNDIKKAEFREYDIRINFLGNIISTNFQDIMRTLR